MAFLYLKALHIIFIVTWFAGLFYIVRLFIYHRENQENTTRTEEEKKLLSEQFALMEKRLWYGITWPSCFLALLFGFSLMHIYFPLTDHPWFIVKLGMVFLLFVYHLSCGKIYHLINQKKFTYSGQHLRFWNEIPTIFLVGITFLIILQDIIKMAYGLIGLILFTGLLMSGILLYRKKRLTS